MPENEKFTDVEKEELEKALGDVFITYASGTSENEFDASEIFPNQLWGSKVLTTNSVLEEYEELRAEYPHEPADELFIPTLEEYEIEDAPKWWEMNPFQFNHKRLEAYFKNKYDKHVDTLGLDLDSYNEHRNKSPDTDDTDTDWEVVAWLYRDAPIYSKKWLELKIYEQFLAINGFTETKYNWWLYKLFAELGRMIEHYRWKFSYETDVIQGHKNRDARKAADDAKPIKAAARELMMLRCIARLWHKACQELGKQAMHKDTNASIAIYAIAEKEMPIELLVKSTGKLKSPDTIRRYLPKLRALGKID